MTEGRDQQLPAGTDAEARSLEAHLRVADLLSRLDPQHVGDRSSRLVRA